jgi:hypothetical protein
MPSPVARLNLRERTQRFDLQNLYVYTGPANKPKHSSTNEGSQACDERSYRGDLVLVAISHLLALLITKREFRGKMAHAECDLFLQGDRDAVQRVGKDNPMRRGARLDRAFRPMQ